MTVLAIVSGLWCIAFFLPFALVGESWGTLWFPLNMPLSGIIEDRYGIGRDSYGWITMVTFVNGVVVGVVLASLSLLVAAARRSR